MHAIFKHNIRQAMAEGEWTQERLARELGVANRTVAGWCLGEVVPRASALERLAKLLGKEPGWFYLDHENRA